MYIEPTDENVMAAKNAINEINQKIEFAKQARRPQEIFDLNIQKEHAEMEFNAFLEDLMRQGKSPSPKLKKFLGIE